MQNKNGKVMKVSMRSLRFKKHFPADKDASDHLKEMVISLELMYSNHYLLVLDKGCCSAELYT